MKEIDLADEKQQNWLNEARKRLREGKPPPGEDEADALIDAAGKPVLVKDLIAAKKREDALGEEADDETDER